MLKEIIQEVDENFEYIGHEYRGERIIIHVKSKREEVLCPYCGKKSKKNYSKYTRRVQDLPIQGKTVMIEIESRKLYCENPDCEKKTFVEPFECVRERSRMTKRLEEKITQTSKHTSSITASDILKGMGIRVGKSTICKKLKKNSIPN